MKLRPTIFLSSVSSEFASFRDAAEIEVKKKGCFPLNEPSFPVDYSEIEELLRRHLSEADAMIQIVGFRYGSEPKGRPGNRPRRSYTQMEYDIARELNIPVYVFISADANVRDANPAEQPEDDEVVQLQLAYRQFPETPNRIRYSFNDKTHLRALVAGIPLLATADFRPDISRIVEYAPAELVGREEELALLDDAWLKVRGAESRRPHILTFVALGGEGKTSLIAKWAAELAYHNWPGCDSAFAWSFYSQGTREQYAASSDLFLKEAITFFGNKEDAEFAASNAGAYEKGQRLARIVSQRRSLLILDGLEPLQYAPTSPTPGELKDAGLLALLKSLAADSEGLCIVTTRYSLPNLRAFWQTTVREVPLLRLSNAAGVHLLKTLGVNGRETEFEKLVEDVKGHALTLNLLGTYLRDAHGGDIRRRDLVKLEEADAEEQAGHAFRVMEAYEDAFKNEGEKGKRALSILRLLGLFDRPISAGSLGALLQKPTIRGLTDPLVGLSEAQRNLVLKRLEDAKLLTVNRESSSVLVALDAHPLLKEYFARQLRAQQFDAWRAAHKRIYEHLCTTTPDKPKATLEDLQPLYQAMVHGCNAGLQRQTYNDLYMTRIRRGLESYSTRRLGAFATDLGAVTCFFETPWNKVTQALPKTSQAELLVNTSFRLRALGRLTEAIEPLRAGLAMFIRFRDWDGAAVAASNLSEFQVTLGEVANAITNAEESIKYSDRTNNAFARVKRRGILAHALHQKGRLSEAERRFSEAERMQAKYNPKFPLLYSLGSFLYCELLLGSSELVAWQHMLKLRGSSVKSSPPNTKAKPLERQKGSERRDEFFHVQALDEVRHRAELTLQWAKEVRAQLLDIALNHLILNRIEIYRAAILKKSRVLDRNLSFAVDNTVDEIRSAGTTHHLPACLLSRAWLRFLVEARIGSESAREDLDEAWEIAERGPMKLHMADIHLYRARLFFREEMYPWESPQMDLGEAERLINECGYHRRDAELADAKRAILNQSV